MATVAGPRRGTWRNTASGEYLAEFLGTFVLIMFGDGVVAMAVAALNSSGRAATKTTIFLATGDWLLIVFGWMFAVICGVYVAGGVTGAHINPAVTVANAVKRGFPWGKVPGYILAQVAGAFVAAAVVFWVYHNAIDTYLVNTHAVKKTSLATYSIFATFPAPYYHNIGGPFLDEAVGTFLLGAGGVRDLRRVQHRTPGQYGAVDRRRHRRPRSAPRLVQTPDTPSTRLVTSGRGCSRGLRGGASLPYRELQEHGDQVTAVSMSTSGYRLSRLLWAA